MTPTTPVPTPGARPYTAGLAGIAVTVALWVAAVLPGGCGHASREVVVRERVMVARPASMSQGPGDVVSESPPPGPAPGGAAVAPPAGPAYDTEEEAAYFYDELAPYGHWIEVAEYGPCWQPNECPPGWRPYTVGHWEFTEEAGWYWESDEPFGWCCFHYGRWAFIAGTGWCWAPGREWAAAWVVWRHGGGFIGWAPMAPAGRGVTVRVEVEEPPHWTFSFVEERYVIDVRLREHIEPVTRNITLVNVTTNVTRYEVVNGRYVNRGVDVNVIERAAGRPVPRRRLADVADRRSAGVRGNDVAAYRPRLPARGERTASAREPAPRDPAGRETVGRETMARELLAREAPPRFVPAPTPGPSPAEVEARRRGVEAYHQVLQNEMARRHERELRSPPPGLTHEQLLSRQALERRAFGLQRGRELETGPPRPRVVRRL